MTTLPTTLAGLPAQSAASPLSLSAQTAVGRLEYALLLVICLCFAGELSFFFPRGAAVDASHALSEGNPINQLVYGTAYLLTVALFIHRRFPVTAILARIWPLTLLVGFIALSAGWSEHPDVSIRRSVGLIGTTMVGIYLGWRLDQHTLIVLLARVCAICVIFSLLVVIAMPERGVMSSGNLAGNWRGMYGHKNILGVTAAVSVVTILFAARAGGRFSPWWACAVGASVLAIVGSRSTTALASLVAMAGIYLLFRLRAVDRPLKLAAFGCVMLTGVLAVLSGLVDLDAVMGSIGKSSDLTGRWPLWTRLVETSGEHLLLGHGYGAFWLGSNPIVVQIWSDGYFKPIDAHNGLLNVYLDLGVLGVLIFLAWLGSALYLALHQLDRHDLPTKGFLFALLLLFVIYSVSEAIFLRANGFLWILMVVASVRAFLSSAAPAVDAPRIGSPS